MGFFGKILAKLGFGDAVAAAPVITPPAAAAPAAAPAAPAAPAPIAVVDVMALME